MQDVCPSVGFDVKQKSLNATGKKNYGLEAIDESFQVVTQQFNDRLTNYEISESECKRKSKLKVFGQHNSYGSFGAWE